MSPHWCELQISIVIGHVVEHVCHGNHHRWVGGLLLLVLLILFIVFLFLWLLEATEEKKRQWLKEMTGEFHRTKKMQRPICLKYANLYAMTKATSCV